MMMRVGQEKLHFLGKDIQNKLLFSVLKVVQGGRIWAMCITPASHFRRALSGGEIQRLRRLMREGSPERISRS